MSDPFLYTGAKITVDGIDLDASGGRTQIVGPSGEVFSAIGSGEITRTFTADLTGEVGKSMSRRLKGLTAVPLSVPSAQEIVMRQELGEFN